MKARLVEGKEIAAGTGGFTFELEGPLGFESGQTLDITIPSPTYQDDKGAIRTFSIASTQADLPRVMVATRLTGSAFKRTLLDASPGLEVDLDGPYGSFVLHKNAKKPAVFFAGGIGITPFHSIIKDATERQLPHALTLFYSNRTPASAAFLGDLERYEKANPNFRLVATITDTPADPSWKRETGLMNAAFVKTHLGDAANAIYYLAGPAAFVTALRTALAEIGTDPDDIRTEEFPGY